MLQLCVNIADVYCLHCLHNATSYARQNILSESSRYSKNGGAEGGGQYEREFQQEAGEQPIKVGWTSGTNEM